ncbi:MAG: hypothetical protein WDN30_05830 [Pararobbsia sp.]
MLLRLAQHDLLPNWPEVVSKPNRRGILLLEAFDEIRHRPPDLLGEVWRGGRFDKYEWIRTALDDSLSAAHLDRVREACRPSHGLP